ncbi:pullulanase-associated domain-containing protein, partial [Niameybacter sp.]|uniref:pullulanase-associated domain-containing protein n=2 Tax=Niameybacter sp. TaxID=2033640 RepID=UPI002FC89D11
VPLVLPMMGTVYDQDEVKHEEVPVKYEVVPVEGIEAEAICLTTVDGKTEVKINGAYPLKTVKLQASAMLQQEKYTASVVLKVEESLYTYTINYLRPTGDYEGWNLWVWIDGKEGMKKDFDAEENFEIKDDSIEGKTTYTFKQVIYQIPESKLNFITRQKVGENEWGKQDPDRLIQVPQGETQEEVWIIDGDNQVYTNYQDIDFAKAIVNAFAETSDEVYVSVNKEVGPLINPYLQNEKGEKLPVTTTKLKDKAYSFKINTALKPDELYSVGADGPNLVLSP